VPSEKTTLLHFDPSAAPGWTVYRVQTRSSGYHVAIGMFCGRKLGVIRGRSARAAQAGEAPIQEGDGAPLVGDDSLFEVAPEMWVGKSLRIGAIVTSPVVAVALETDVTMVHAITGALSPSSSPTSSRDGERVARTSSAPPAPSAEAIELSRITQYAEVAAWCLRRLDEDEGGLRFAMHDATSGMRIHDALTECAQLLRALSRKL
jgi:hypothetical protein